MKINSIQKINSISQKDQQHLADKQINRIYQTSRSVASSRQADQQHLADIQVNSIYKIGRSTQKHLADKQISSLQQTGRSIASVRSIASSRQADQKHLADRQINSIYLINSIQQTGRSIVPVSIRSIASSRQAIQLYLLLYIEEKSNRKRNCFSETHPSYKMFNSFRANKLVVHTFCNIKIKLELNFVSQICPEFKSV